MAEQCTTGVFIEHQEAHYSAWVLLELDHMSVSQLAGAWHDCVQVVQLYYVFQMLKRANPDMVNQRCCDIRKPVQHKEHDSAVHEYIDGWSIPCQGQCELEVTPRSAATVQVAIESTIVGLILQHKCKLYSLA